jgi:hypothetical protein
LVYHTNPVGEKILDPRIRCRKWKQKKKKHMTGNGRKAKITKEIKHYSFEKTSERYDI